MKPNPLRPLIDVTLSILGLVLLLVHLPTEGDIKPPVDYILEVSWTGDLDIDLDVYVLTPDGEKASYNRKDIGTVTIDRDDLGRANDAGLANVEYVSFRSLPDGWYYISIRTYRNRESTPFEAAVTIRKTGSRDKPFTWIGAGPVEKKELPMVKFWVKGGLIQAESISRSYREIVYE